LNDGQTGNSHSWISNVPGKGSITLTWPKPATIDRVVWGRDRDEAYRDRLPTEYFIEAALEPAKWQVVASSLDRFPYDPNAKPATSLSEVAALKKRQSELRSRLAALSTIMKVYAGTFKEPGKTHLLLRGDPIKKGPEVPPAGVAALKPA